MNDFLLFAFSMAMITGYGFLLSRMVELPELTRSFRRFPNRFYFYLITIFMWAILIFLLAKIARNNWLVASALIMFQVSAFFNLVWLGLNFNRRKGWVVRPIAFTGLVGTVGLVILAFGLGQREQPGNFVGDNVNTDLHFWYWLGYNVGLVYMLGCLGRTIYEALSYAAHAQTHENDGTKYRLYVLSFLCGCGALYCLVVLIQLDGSYFSGSMEFDQALMGIRDLTFLPIFLSVMVLLFADRQLFRLYLRFYRYRQMVKFAKLRPFFEEVHRNFGGFIRINPYEFALDGEKGSGKDKIGSNAKGEQNWRLVAAITGLEDVRKHIWWTQAWLKATVEGVEINQLLPVTEVEPSEEARLWYDYLRNIQLKAAIKYYLKFATPPNALPPLPARTFDERVDYYVKLGKLVQDLMQQERVKNDKSSKAKRSEAEEVRR
jgi:hypothetical protein